LDADIQAFYDTIPHKLIMDRLREKIADGWVLNRIENMLKAGVMEDGILHKTTKGTIRDVTKRSQGVNPTFAIRGVYEPLSQ